jgi:hypothetical protein
MSASATPPAVPPPAPARIESKGAEPVTRALAAPPPKADSLEAAGKPADSSCEAFFKMIGKAILDFFEMVYSFFCFSFYKKQIVTPFEEGGVPLAFPADNAAGFRAALVTLIDRVNRNTQTLGSDGLEVLLIGVGRSERFSADLPICYNPHDAEEERDGIREQILTAVPKQTPGGGSKQAEIFIRIAVVRLNGYVVNRFVHEINIKGGVVTEQRPAAPRGIEEMVYTREGARELFRQRIQDVGASFGKDEFEFDARGKLWQPDRTSTPKSTLSTEAPRG